MQPCWPAMVTVACVLARRRAGSEPGRFFDSDAFVPAELAPKEGGDAQRQAAWLNDLTSWTRAMPKHHPPHLPRLLLPPSPVQPPLDAAQQPFDGIQRYGYARGNVVLNTLWRAFLALLPLRGRPAFSPPLPPSDSAATAPPCHCFLTSPSFHIPGRALAKPMLCACSGDSIPGIVQQLCWSACQECERLTGARCCGGCFVCRVTSGGQLKQALPRHLAKPGAAALRRAAATESGAALAGRIRVLIAEDNAINMKVACGILDRMGYKQARALHSPAFLPLSRNGKPPAVGPSARSPAACPPWR